ncbi:MAG: hypothetical protein AAB432_01290 [Patescibacteria group bacterium]
MSYPHQAKGTTGVSIVILMISTIMIITWSHFIDQKTLKSETRVFGRYTVTYDKTSNGISFPKNVNLETIINNKAVFEVRWADFTDKPNIYRLRGWNKDTGPVDYGELVIGEK